MKQAQEFEHETLTLYRTQCVNANKVCYYCKENIQIGQVMYLSYDSKPVFYFGLMYLHFYCLSKYLKKYDNEK